MSQLVKKIQPNEAFRSMLSSDGTGFATLCKNLITIFWPNRSSGGAQFERNILPNPSPICMHVRLSELCDKLHHMSAIQKYRIVLKIQ